MRSCSFVSPCALSCFGDEVALRDAELLVLGVAGELDDVHAVEQRPGNRVERVRGADEQHLREVERQVEVVVAEVPVLLRVEHLEHRARRVAAEVGAHLVDLVDQQHRIQRLGVAQRADDRPRHRADVGAAVAADLGLVAHAADRDAHELAPERARDRLAERRLADARRPDEAEDRPGDLALELRDGEVLDDPLLDLVEVVVVLVEDPAGLLEVEVVLGRLVPRQREDPLEVRADDAVLGRGRRELLEPRELALAPPSATSSGSSSASSRSRSSLISACSASPSPSSSWIAFSCWRRKNSRWPFSISDWTCDWIFVPSSSTSSSRFRIVETSRSRSSTFDELEQPLLLLGLEAHRRGDEVAERARVLDVRRGELQLLGQVRDERDHAREEVLDVARQRLDLARLDEHVRAAGENSATRYGSSCDRAGRGADALGALDEDPQRPVGHADQLVDDRGRADLVEVVEAGRLDLLVLRPRRARAAARRRRRRRSA